jgi:glutamate synthase domain-containing protein 2
MLSLGCIQARECNMNTCPVGIATQNKTLIGALNPAEKKVRVYNYHKAVIREVRELLGAMGLTNIDQLTSEHIMHRDENSKLKNY